MAEFTSFLAWCLIINYGLLVVWFIALLSARAAMYRLHSRWFDITESQFKQANYLVFAIYKILVLVFILVPYVALKLIR